MTTHLLGGALCLLLLPAASDGTRLAHRAEAGTELVRTYRVGGEMHLVELSLMAAGEEHAPDDLPEILLRGESRYVVRDELLDVQAGELRRLRRTYDALEDSRTIVSPDGETLQERESELDGETVLFVRDEETGDWRARDEDGSLDRELLDGLRADLSLAAFLPPREVEEGDTWRLAGEQAAHLLQPLGELDLRPPDEPQSDAVRELAERLRDSLQGTVEATYRGTREVQGLLLAVIELELDVSLAASIEVPGEGTQEVTIERVLSGELLWNVEAARLHSVELSGQTAETTTQVRDIPTPDGGVEVRQLQRFEGSRVYTIEVTEG